MVQLGKRLGLRKPIDRFTGDADSHGLRRSLGPIQLIMLGIGCIIGAGVFVMTGTAAAHHAGPAVVLSFAIAGLACTFTGLCYAELSTALPVSGSSYSYCYAAMGEGAAWALGWLLMLEYGLAGSALAVGLSGYLSSLLGDFGLIVPASLNSPLIAAVPDGAGTRFVLGDGVNLLAAAALLLFAWLLTRGVSQSASVNAAMVVFKLLVLIIFIVVGWTHVDPAHWQPFLPPNEGGFRFGTAGVLRAASILFFAYLGFETVSTAALEARNPQRDMPIGILGALIICTTIYILVALVLTGLVDYRRLGVPDPIALAVDSIGLPAFTLLIKLGAVAGLCSVLLVNTYGHSRICYAMARDGLLPKLFARVHAERRTPWLGTWTVALVSALAALLLPISLLADLVSIGVAAAFSIVALSVMWLRTERPDLPRAVRVPLGGVTIRGVWIGTVPVLALLLCLAMAVPVLLDIALKAWGGAPLPAIILGSYLVAGVAAYLFYGARHSVLGREAIQRTA